MLMMSILWSGCGTEGPPDMESQKPQPPVYTSVTLYEVTPEPFVHRFSVQGNVETDQNALLTAEFAGIIESILVREGEFVSVGQPLALINTDVLDRSIAELQTQLDLATELFNRQERLWNQSIGSEVEWMQARAQKESLEHSMSRMQEQLDKAEVQAPFSGVLERCLAKNGEMAIPGSPLMRLINIEDMYVRASVSDHYASRVTKNMRAQVIVSGVDSIDTHVRRVGQYINPSNRTLEITLPLPNGTKFLPNMYASVWLEDLSIDSAVVVPSALIQQDVNGDDFVFVAIGKGLTREVSKRLLDVGMGSHDAMLILSGLEPGDAVIAKGSSRVISGQTVGVVAQ